MSGFIATEHFEVAQNAFWRTCWNDTKLDYWDER
jgi:hypothetical protein